MSYLQFHLVFVIPPILLLAWLGRRRLTRRHLRVMIWVCAVALAFTLPWDHAAVVGGIWGFDNARVIGRLWLLPFEEILFFVLETVGVCLLCLLFLPRPPFTPSR